MSVNYMLISIIILAVAIAIPFFAFEKRKPKARHVVMIAVMSALTVVANIICAYTIPLHAGTALVIITGIAFGPQTGFLTGVLSRFVCNFFMGQGVWTPWEMAAWRLYAFGLVGIIAAVLFMRSRIPCNFITVTIFTFISVFVIYGGIMNIAAMMMNSTYTDSGSANISLNALKLLYITGAPYDAMHAGGAAVCAFLFGDGLLGKLTRARIKYVL